MEEALTPPVLETEDRADRQRDLDRDVRVGALAAGLPLAGAPGMERII